MISRSRYLTQIAAVLLLWAFVTSPAAAFCGFYVTGADSQLYANATMVVLMRDGTRTVLSMQNNYQGPAEDFALVIPVPTVLKEEQVKTLPRDVFARVDALGAPRLVEYWEQDPCSPVNTFETSGASGATTSSGASSKGTVTVEASFAVGEYDIVILSADDSSGLETWLHDNHYNIPSGADEVLAPYVAMGTKFFVAKVDPARVTFQGTQAALSPLRFYYDAADFSLPIRLGLLNSHGQQDLIVNILAPDRYEVSNHPNALIPTNIRVHDEVRKDFGGFYEALFSKVMDKNPGAVVTEYAWVWSNCDPCPSGQMLSSSDIATLGADVTQAVASPTSASGATGGSSAPSSSVSPKGGGGFAFASNNYTLTRLHYRYTRETLGDDLVFKKASPITGGRGVPDTSGELTMLVGDSEINNFQGRYAILHPWADSLSCQTPHRGNWGGPPRDGASGVMSATNTALVGAPPKAGALPALLAQSLTSLDVVAENPVDPLGEAPASGCECSMLRSGQLGAKGFVAVSGGLLLGLSLWARRRRRDSSR
jgi:hypothetical protein